MGRFRTKIMLEEMTEKKNGVISGKFVIDAEQLNLYKVFSFSIAKHTLSVYKEGKLFLRRKCDIPNEIFQRLREEQKMILTSLTVILKVKSNTIDLDEFALTTKEPGSKVCINTTTPDQLGQALMRACL